MRFQIHHKHDQGWSQLILTDSQTGTSATIIPAAGAILNAFSIEHQGKTLRLSTAPTGAADSKEKSKKPFKAPNYHLCLSHQRRQLPLK
jgi:hypothetical protein